METVRDRGVTRRAAAAAVGAAIALPSLAAPPGKAETNPAKAPGRRAESLFKISLAQWSLHRAYRAGNMTLLDFPWAAKNRFGLDAIEYVNVFFDEAARQPAKIRELRARCDDLGVKSLLIMCDGEGALGDADEAGRKLAVENHRKWLDAAAALGCHSIRVNAQSRGTRDEQSQRAADGLGRLADLARPMKLDVIVENHGGLSSDGGWLAAVMREANRPNLGTLPDFGNFRVSQTEEYDRYKGVEELMPFAKAVSAKSYAFNERGEETTIDYQKMLRIVTAAGYHGYVGVEYEGEAHAEPEGIRKTISLLEDVRKRLGAE